MPYVGVAPSSGLFKKLDSITVVNGQAAYTMQYNSVNFKPGTASQLIVSVNGVIQAPEDAFTIDGSTITFTENLVTGDVIDFIVALGEVGNTVTPVDGSVTTAKLANDAVTEDKLANSLDMQSITLKGGTTDALTIDSSGNVSIKKAKKSIFRARRTSNQTISHNTTTVVQFDAEDFDPDTCYDTSTYKWTPVTAGYYHIEANVDVNYDNNEDVTVSAVIRKNGSTELLLTRSFDVGSGSDNSFHLSGVVYSDGDDNFDVTIYHYDYTNTSSSTVKGASYSRTWFSGHLIQEA